MEKLKKLSEHWKVIAGLISAITLIWGVFTYVDNINDNIEQVLKTSKTTQQMALKSVIWNDAIPLTERASACDVYTNAGYNSMTKKECQVIVDKGAEQGIFSYAREEE